MRKTFSRSVIHFGNSLGLTLPKTFIEINSIKYKDNLSLEIDKKDSSILTVKFISPEKEENTVKE